MINSLVNSLKRRAWFLSAAAAALLLLSLALYSPDRQKGLTDFQAAGPMRHIPTADIVALRIVAGERQWHVKRAAAGWRLAGAGALLDAGTNSAIETGLRLLHNTPPERGFDAESSEFGLTPPALRVSLTSGSGAAFEAEFGSANPMGLARYVRIRERGLSALQLMPAYVAEPWERAVGRLQQ